MLKLKVEAMSCGHCVRTIQGTLGKAAPQAVVKIDLGRQEVSLDTDLDPALAMAALKAAGYDATVI